MVSGKNVPPAGWCVWLTGLPASGKSTIAAGLKKALRTRGCPVKILDGDELRRRVSADLGFSRRDRKTHVLRVARLARKIIRSGQVVVCALVSPFEAVRRSAATIIGRKKYFLIFVDTPPAVCERRDPKGLYRLARRGKIKNFTGIDDPYQRPKKPDLIISTVRISPQKNAARIMKFLEKKKLFPFVQPGGSGVKN